MTEEKENIENNTQDGKPENSEPIRNEESVGKDKGAEKTEDIGSWEEKVEIIHIKQEIPESTKYFKIGLFGCLNNPVGCILSYFCPGISACIIAHNIDAMAICWGIVGCINPCLAIFCLRMQIRELKRIEVILIKI